jgi:hypothetical protein
MMRQQPFASPGEALTFLREKRAEVQQQAFSSPGEAMAHFGVKGMRWGVRKAEETSDRVKSGDSKAGNPVLAVYAAVLIGGVYVTVRDNRRAQTDSGEHHQQKNANVVWKKKPELSKPNMSVDDIRKQVVKPTNPRYPLPGTKMNCRRCTFTYELRRRGYDVEATRSHYATGQDLEGVRNATMNFSGTKSNIRSRWGQNEISNSQHLASMKTEQRSKVIFDQLAKHPNGARGELAYGWKMGGGHSVAWEIVNGKPVIFDAQSSRVYRDPHSFRKHARAIHDVGYTRTDNSKLDEAFLRRWVTNA